MFAQSSRFIASAFTFAALTACATPPANLDLSLQKQSASGRYVVTLEPPPVVPAINQMHSWTVKLTDTTGSAVTGARIAVGGGMPQHGHGFPTRPRVTREIEGGAYVVEGMKFSMPGWWNIKFDIQSGIGEDKVTFNTVVAPATAHADELHVWSPEEATIIASLRLSQAGPAVPDPSNAYENSDGARQLGRALFEDQRLSANGKVSCATCHVSGNQFTDALPRGQGIGTGERRTMPIMGAQGSPFLFWDGRKDSLWSQALGPLEDAREHGGNRVAVAKQVASRHREGYEQVFGALPDLQMLPEAASPAGTAADQAAWAHMNDPERMQVNRIFSNVGKAIAAFERTINYGESRFDRYAEAVASGDPAGQHLLSPQEVRGLQVFIGEGQCVTCHNGPQLTDHAFHNTGVPASTAVPDEGRQAGIRKLLADEFNCLGPYSDAQPAQCTELQFLTDEDGSLAGSFRTPSLRNVAQRPPYMHAGQFTTLEQVIRHYMRAPAATMGRSEITARGGRNPDRIVIRLGEADARDLAAFLESLTGPLIQASQ